MNSCKDFCKFYLEFFFLHFRFRSALCCMKMPAIGLATPLFLLMNSLRVFECSDGIVAIQPFLTCSAGGELIFNLRDSLWGVGIAMISGALPFAVWNLKGYLDTIPKELEGATVEDMISGKVQLPVERDYGGGIRALVTKHPGLKTELWGGLPGQLGYNPD